MKKIQEEMPKLGWLLQEMLKHGDIDNAHIKMIESDVVVYSEKLLAEQKAEWVKKMMGEVEKMYDYHGGFKTKKRCEERCESCGFNQALNDLIQLIQGEDL